MPHSGQRILIGRLDQNPRGLVLRCDDGHVFSLPDVHGSEGMLGDYVRIVGIVNDADRLNPFRIERDEHHQGFTTSNKIVPNT